MVRITMYQRYQVVVSRVCSYHRKARCKQGYCIVVVFISGSQPVVAFFPFTSGILGHRKGASCFPFLYVTSVCVMTGRMRLFKITLLIAMCAY